MIFKPVAKERIKKIIKNYQLKLKIKQVQIQSKINLNLNKKQKMLKNN